VPDDQQARAIASVLDLSWAGELSPLYPALGRPSIDPVLMIRELILGYAFPGFACVIGAARRDD